jgi:hypothetical protein
MSNIAPDDEISLEKENRSLRKRIDELERTLSDVEAAKREPIPRSTVQRWKIVAFGILLTASLIPSYLVVRDRWLENMVQIESVNKFWWETEILKALPYPQYFLLIFISTLLAMLIVLFWREKPLLVFSNLNLGVIETSDQTFHWRKLKPANYLLVAAFVTVAISAIWMIVTGRIPGWDLLLALALFLTGLILSDSERISWRERFRTQGQFIVDAVLFIIAVCAALYSTFGEQEPNLIFYILLILATLNFLKHRNRTHPIFWVSLFSLVALTWNIDGWNYVVIGDEYSFFVEVQNILDNRTAWELINTTFNGTFVYGTHPYLSSYIHDFFMKMFDNRNFGWRFSNPVLVACSLPLFYYFFKAFVPRRIAIMIVILLGFSHYLLSFSKIGYNNLQALFIMGAVLAAFAWALKSMRPLAFCVTGLCMGLCFYLYPAALYVVPLPIIGLLFFLPPTNKEALKRWSWMAVSAAILFYPLIAQPNYWAAKVAGTFMYTDAGNSFAALIENISRNALFSGLSYLYMPEQTHFVSVGYLDALSSVFVVIGFVVLVKTVFQRNKSALFLITSFLMIFFLVGATHGRNFPTATRMFLLLPWFALFTAFGLEWCLETAKSFFHVDQRAISTLLVGAIVFVNLYHTYIIDVQNMVQYHTLAPLFVKVAREINANKQIPTKSYAFVSAAGWNTEGLRIVQRAYQVPDSPTQLINVPLEGNQLPDSAQELVSQRDIVVIVQGNLEENTMTTVDIQLLTWGKSVCEIRNGKGVLQFQLWHSGDLGWLCQ